METIAVPPSATMFGGGARVSWHFGSLGPEVTVEVEEHPTATAATITSNNANGYRPVLFANTAVRREGGLEDIKGLQRKYTPLGRCIPCASHLMSWPGMLPR
jgi:hypothetical protein